MHGEAKDPQNVALRTPDVVVNGVESQGRPYKSTINVETLIDHAFPNVNDAKQVVSSRILCLTNDSCHEINELVLKRVHGAVVTRFSRDSLYNEDRTTPAEVGVQPNSSSSSSSSSNPRPSLHEEHEWLHMLNDSSAPLHELKLKVNSLVMLMHNMCLEDGLTNNTVAIVRQIGLHVVFIEPVNIVTGQLTEQRFAIPRVSFRFTGAKGIEVERKQFPLRLAYAVTVHKAQGITLNRGGIDLRSLPFTHGQLYVAVSRFSCVNSLMILHADRPCNVDRKDRAVLSRNVTFVKYFEKATKVPLFVDDQTRRERLSNVDFVSSTERHTEIDRTCKNTNFIS